MNLKTLKTQNSLKLVFILVLGIVLKLWFSSQKDLSNDEVFSIYHAQFNIPELFKELSTGNNPPFFEGMLHFWIKLFGIGKFSVRLPSIIFSVLSTLFIFQLAKLITGNDKNIALLSSLLFTLSSFYTDLQIETRAYSFMTLLVIFNSYSFINLILKNNKTIWLIYWVVASAVGYYTHFFTFWISFIQLIFLILHFRKTNLKIFIVGAIFSAILFSPYISILLQRFSDTEQSGTWVEPASANSFYFIIWQFCNSPIAAILFLIAFIGFTIVSVRKTNFLHQYILIWFWIPFAAMYFISLPHKFSIPMFTARYVSFVFPAFFIGVSVFLFETRRFLKSQIYSWIPIVYILLMIVSIKPKPTQNIFFEASKISIKKYKPQSIIIQPYYGTFSYLYYNEPENFQKFASENIYNHMENQLFKSNIYSSRIRSFVNLNATKSILFIQGELSRKEEITVVEDFLKSKEFMKSNQKIFEDKNCRILTYTK